MDIILTKFRRLPAEYKEYPRSHRVVSIYDHVRNAEFAAREFMSLNKSLDVFYIGHFDDPALFIHNFFNEIRKIQHHGGGEVWMYSDGPVVIYRIPPNGDMRVKDTREAVASAIEMGMRKIFHSPARRYEDSGVVRLGPEENVLCALR